MFKKISLFSMALLMGTIGSVFAKGDGDQGYGLMLGNPSGLSGKFWFSNQVAIDAAFGIARGEVDAHLDFLFHDYNILKNFNDQNLHFKGDLPVYIGAGPRFLFADNQEFGIRIPIGVSFIPQATPWEFFGEIAPVLRFTPSTGINGDFAIGARYYFDAIHPRQ